MLAYAELEKDTPGTIDGLTETTNGRLTYLNFSMDLSFCTFLRVFPSRVEDVYRDFA